MDQLYTCFVSSFCCLDYQPDFKMYDCPSTNTRKVNLSAFIVASKSSVVPARTIQPRQSRDQMQLFIHLQLFVLSCFYDHCHGNVCYCFWVNQKSITLQHILMVQQGIRLFRSLLRSMFLLVVHLIYLGQTHNQRRGI